MQGVRKVFIAVIRKILLIPLTEMKTAIARNNIGVNVLAEGYEFRYPYSCSGLSLIPATQ